MSSFMGGLMSVGKKLGGAAKTWAQGTRVGRSIDRGRNVVGSFSAKRQPGMKSKGDAVEPSVPGSQEV